MSATTRGLAPLVGHEELRERLGRSVHRGRLPPSLLFHGPEGVGKQRLALWLARRLQCLSPAGPAPCGECRGCRLVHKLEHPDVYWFFPLPRPSGASGSKLQEKLEDARLEALEERRQDPLEPVRHEGSTGIYLAAVREMRSKAARRPAMGPRRVFVVGNAEQMVPQAANPEAANAFLKLLEEPPDDCFVLLTSSRPGSLLATIRSRVLPLRVTPLREEEPVRKFLVDHAGASEEDARRTARMARGSIGRALRLLTPEEQERRDAATELLRAAVQGRAGERRERAVLYGPAGARGEFSRVLETAVELLRDLMGVVTDHPELVFDRERAEEILGDLRPSTAGLLEAQHALEEARRLARGNVNPQVVSAVLLEEMATALADTERRRRAG